MFFRTLLPGIFLDTLTPQAASKSIRMFEFAHKKATQAVNYFARMAGGKISKMKAFKLTFLADRYHLRKYGRSITLDTYFAMVYGPVPSATKNLLDVDESHHRFGKEYSREYVRPLSDREIESVGEVDCAVLSETDSEALEFAWERFGHFTAGQLSNLTHKYPEWAEFEEPLMDCQTKAEKMDCLKFLDDPPPGIDPCFELSDADRKATKESIAETAKLMDVLRT